MHFSVDIRNILPVPVRFFIRTAPNLASLVRQTLQALQLMRVFTAASHRLLAIPAVKACFFWLNI